jgi:hypothetical protein
MLSVARESATLLKLKQRRTFGGDIGSVNMGFAGAECRGLLRLTRPDGTVLKEGVPDIQVLCLERWNLKQGQVLTHDADWNPYVVQLDGFTGDKTENMDQWRRALTACVKRPDKLFALDEYGELPVLVTENQCDISKRDFHKAEMYRLADQFKTVVDFEDQLRQLPQRVNRYANCKYLMRNDGSLATETKSSHDPRKERSIEIGFELCEELGLAGPLKFLRALRDRGEKLDDITDALLLAVQDQLDCMTEEAKQLIRDAKALLKCIPVTPTVKKRQRKALLQPLTEAELEERLQRGLPLTDDAEQEEKKKKPVVKKAAPAKKKNVDTSKTPKRKRATDTAVIEFKSTKRVKHHAEPELLLDVCTSGDEIEVLK